MEQYERIKINFEKPWEYFAVRYYGDSMTNIGMRDDSILVVHKQQTAEDGDIVVALYNDEPIVRYYKKRENKGFLVAGNSKDFPLPISDDISFRILGRVVQMQVNF